MIVTVSNKIYHVLPLSYSFLERDKIRICDLSSKPSPASLVLISNLTNISLQTVSCWFSSDTASYVGLYICYEGYRNSGHIIHNSVYVIHNSV